MSSILPARAGHAGRLVMTASLGTAVGDEFCGAATARSLAWRALMSCCCSSFKSFITTPETIAELTRDGSPERMRDPYRSLPTRRRDGGQERRRSMCVLLVTHGKVCGCIIS